MQIKGTQNLNPGIHIIAVNKTYQDLGLQYIPSLSSTVHFPIQILPKTPLDSVLISLKNNEGYAFPTVAPIIVIAIITIASVLPEFYTRLKKGIRQHTNGHDTPSRTCPKWTYSGF